MLMMSSAAECGGLTLQNPQQAGFPRRCDSTYYKIYHFNHLKVTISWHLEQSQCCAATATLQLLCYSAVPSCSCQSRFCFQPLWICPFCTFYNRRNHTICGLFVSIGSLSVKFSRFTTSWHASLLHSSLGMNNTPLYGRAPFCLPIHQSLGC